MKTEPGKYITMQNKVEEISIRKLLQYAALPPTETSILDMVEMGRDVDRNGVRDPIVIWVNVIDRTIRLDSGNHRVYMMPLMGWSRLPCVCRISNRSVGDPSNGTHWFFSGDIKLEPYFTEEYYEKPSLVIQDILE